MGKGDAALAELDSFQFDKFKNKHAISPYVGKGDAALAKLNTFRFDRGDLFHGGDEFDTEAELSPPGPGSNKGWAYRGDDSGGKRSSPSLEDLGFGGCGSSKKRVLQPDLYL